MSKKKTSSFSDIYNRIPDKFYNRAGFTILIMMISILSVEELYRAFMPVPKWNVYMMFYYLVGAFGEVFSVLYIGSLFYKKERLSLKAVFKKNIWDIALLLMLVWGTISTILAEDKYIAMQGTWYRKDGYYAYLVYAAMYVCGKAITSEKLRLWVFRVLAVTCSLQSLITLLQYNHFLRNLAGDNYIEKLNGLTEYAGIFCNTNHFAYLMTICVMAMAGLVIIEKKNLNKILSLSLLAFNVWSLIINDTFGAYLAVLLGIIFLAIIFIIKNKKNILSVLAVFIVFAGVSLWMDSQIHTISANFGITYSDAKQGTSNDAGGSSRIGLWKQAIRFIEEKPVFGFGPDGLYSRYYEEGYFNDRPHNEFLQHAAFMGIPALIFYLVALIGIFIYCIKRIRKLNVCILVTGGMVFAYLISSFFGNTMYYTTPYYFMILGILSACHRKDAAENAFS